MDVKNDREFWQALDSLVESEKIIIDRPKGSTHPRFSDIKYEVDYGYIENTSSMDGAGIDVWCGTSQDKSVTAIICTVDLMKKDSEIKLLIGVTDEEAQTVYAFHNNNGDAMQGILIPREECRMT